MSWCGAAFLVKIDSIINTEKYHQILTHKEKKSLILQHGKDPKHTANAVKTNLDRKTHKIEHCQSCMGLWRARTSTLLK